MRTATKLGDPGSCERPTAHLSSLLIPFSFGIPFSGSVWLPSIFLLPSWSFWGGVYRLFFSASALLLARASSLFCFLARPGKTKTQLGEPPPAGACASSPLVTAQLPVHTAAKASSTFLTPSPHFTGDREPCVQRKGPSSTDCQSRLGPSSPKMVRQDFILSAEEPQAGLSGRDGAGGRLWVASQIRLCSLKLAAPPGKGFRPELFIELCGGSLVIELSGCFLSSLSTFKTSREMVT